MGSADAIGNPIGLFNHVSQGISDLFYEPYSAIMNVSTSLVRSSKSKIHSRSGSKRW